MTEFETRFFDKLDVYVKLASRHDPDKDQLDQAKKDLTLLLREMVKTYQRFGNIQA